MGELLARQSNKRRAILFDLDGTLLNTFEGITKTVIHALIEMGVEPPNQEDLGWIIGPPLESSFAKILGSADPKLIEEAMRIYRVRYEKTGLYESEMYPGVKNALEELCHVGDVFLATAKPQSYGYEALRHYDLLHYFKAVHGSEFDGTRTHKEELIAYILEKENLSPERALMIGDRKYDILGARANKVTGVGVTWGYGSSRELVEAGARILVERTDELPEIEHALSFRRAGSF